MTKKERAITIAKLRELQAHRHACMKMTTRITNQRIALVKRFFGYDPTLPEKERNKINIKAAKFVKDVLASKKIVGQKKLAGLISAVLVYQESYNPMKIRRLALEKERKSLAESLPGVASFVKSRHGVGIDTLAVVIGECGDLADYPDYSKVWKRMGLAVINGESQRKRTDPALALLHGYSPRRRSAMWVVGDALIRAGGPYKDIYDKRKVYEQKTSPDLSVGHIHKRAHRYMEKKFLEHLWMLFNPLELEKAA